MKRKKGERERYNYVVGVIDSKKEWEERGKKGGKRDREKNN